MRWVSRSHVWARDRHARYWTSLGHSRAATVGYNRVLVLHLALLSQNALSHTGSVLLCTRIARVSCRIAVHIESCMLAIAVILVQSRLVLMINWRAIWHVSRMIASSSAERALTSLLMRLLLLSLQVNLSQAFGCHLLDLLCRGLRVLCLKLVSD